MRKLTLKTLYLNGEDLNQLAEQAKAEQRSTAFLVRVAIAEYLKRGATKSGKAAKK